MTAYSKKEPLHNYRRKEPPQSYTAEQARLQEALLSESTIQADISKYILAVHASHSQCPSIRMNRPHFGHTVKAAF